MPSRNTVKQFTSEGYYHVYNRGIEKRLIFADDKDYSVFLNLLKRYLGSEQAKDQQGRPYPWFNQDIKLLAFCLLPNHFHLLIYQKESESMTALMRGLMTSYTMYFNHRHKRTGHLFQGIYKASLIDDTAYLEHISRYIHLNPGNWRSWEWSSLPYYLSDKHADWVQPQDILEMFKGSSYLDFVADYEDYKKDLDALKADLADG